LQKEILKEVARLGIQINFGTPGQLMDLSLRVIINPQSLVGELMKNGCQKMLFSIAKDVKQVST
jgi:hypothetical protein